MRLLLIRHGQTPSNVAGALDTARPGAGLTAVGHAQAAAIPDVLGTERLDGLYASVLTRTQLTAQPLAAARGLDIVVREGLEEISAGAFEMQSHAEAVHAYIESGLRWAGGDLHHSVDGGETGAAFFDRFDAAIAEIADTDDAAAVVSHGAAIRVWASTRAVNVASEEAVQRRLMNTGMCVLEGDPDSGWLLQRWHEEPLGGIELDDRFAQDVTGEPEEADAVIAEDSRR
ncbi:histidine phosphatase family protein [Microbacterium paludicola]|uniref:histidine phosphatase family protein n=1 Tax=Microbacterium paludicola TaxID=300019 RepID=UPI00119D6844|nr:histidine phosphatase family protein [Microbacterium paludicola]